MQWWCSAQGTQWRWTWVPYPGVWLFVLAATAIAGTGGISVGRLATRRANRRSR